MQTSAAKQPELIATFQNLRKSDVALAGGKGASLGEMTRAGIPVPPGFVILTPAFQQFVDKNKLADDLSEPLAKFDPHDASAAEVISEQIRNTMMKAEMPHALQEEIVSDFRGLKTRFVAVRSSATAEDTGKTSWAGELESYLNTTEKDLLDNVKRCWASLFTPRALHYRAEHGLLKTDISVAVVVQQMVDSEVSGIMFTAHPVTKDRDMMVIEAAFGLGEAIVQGMITPDTYIVNKKDLTIFDTNIGTQTKKIIRNKRGHNETIELSEQEGSKRALAEPEILDVAKLGMHIEQHYQFPQDIEFARAKGTTYIVQSRPITTL